MRLCCDVIVICTRRTKRTAPPSCQSSAHWLTSVVTIPPREVSNQLSIYTCTSNWDEYLQPRMASTPTPPSPIDVYFDTREVHSRVLHNPNGCRKVLHVPSQSVWAPRSDLCREWSINELAWVAIACCTVTFSKACRIYQELHGKSLPSLCRRERAVLFSCPRKRTDGAGRHQRKSHNHATPFSFDRQKNSGQRSKFRFLLALD